MEEDKKEYEVISLSMGGKNNKIFNSGDIVTAEDFEEGDIPQLIKDGFLKEKKVEKKK